MGHRGKHMPGDGGINFPGGSKKVFEELARRGVPPSVARKAADIYGYDNVFLWAGFEAMEDGKDFAVEFVKRFPKSL